MGPPLPPGTLAQLVVLDAGSGAATSLFASNHTWLIDSGSDFFAGSVTLPFLRTSGVNRLDALVLTHGDAQHIGGFEQIAPALHPVSILDSGLPDRSPTRRRILQAAPTAATHAGAAFSVDPKYPRKGHLSASGRKWRRRGRPGHGPAHRGRNLLRAF